MKQTKKTDNKLMFSQIKDKFQLEKTDKGIEITLIGDMVDRPYEKIMTITNVVSIIDWINKKQK